MVLGPGLHWMLKEPWWLQRRKPKHGSAESLGPPRSVFSCHPLWKLSPETTQCVLLCLQGQAQKFRVPEPESMELGHRPGKIGRLPVETGFLRWGGGLPYLLSLAEASRWNGLTDPVYFKCRRKLEERTSEPSRCQAWKF